MNMADEIQNIYEINSCSAHHRRYRKYKHIKRKQCQERGGVETKRDSVIVLAKTKTVQVRTK